MADLLQCEDKEIHDFHDWEETKHDVKLYHLCIGVPLIHHRELYHANTSCGLELAYRRDNREPTDRVATKDLKYVTCKDCLEAANKENN